ncbi:MAG: SIS domain-containing protein [Acidimicrobiia bacterium]|nr:MAG: SIS domain-containing protein [Acidimicrobiia bacterium]
MSLLEEIFEQVQSLERVIARNRDTAAQIAQSWHEQGVDHVLIAARGTSDNAARYAQYVWGARNRLSVGLAAPSLFSVYDSPPSLGNSAVVGISQSGESPDIVGVLAEANRQKRPTLAITNEASSPLAEEADRVILLHAGREVSIAATKTYTAELAAVAMLSAAMQDDQGTDRVIFSVPSHVEYMLDQSEDIARMAQAHSSLDRCSVVGRGFNHATAFEWALKLQELAYVLAQPFSTADFLHGPVALVEPGFPILAVAASGPPLADVHSLLEELVERDAALVVISDVEATLALTSSAIRLPGDTSEWITPIPAVVGAQLFTYHLTVAKGLDPDRPRGLAKVTRTL